ncbi:MAG: hypothetical protein M0P73_07435 [Syntrophobacterales bacterium]|jgi:hypothetical protein|nr:hypothetical protein [Syntrophobacterales bacterium]
MGIIKFIFYVGIINIVFSFIWKWIFVVPAAIFFTLINFDKGMIVVKAFGAYLLISLLGILSLGFIEENIISDKIYLIIIGSFMIYMILSNTFYEARKKALVEYNYELLERLNREEIFNILIIICSIIYFIYIFIDPMVAINSLTYFLFKTIDWAVKLPILGILLAIGGIIYLLSTVWFGICYFIFLISLLFGRSSLSEK